MLEEIILRTVIQRTKNAEVIIESISQGKFEQGLVVFFGVGFKNNVLEIAEADVDKILSAFTPLCEKLADKLLALRIFSDSEDKMNLSVKNINGGIYFVSQFTPFADAAKGNRPSFMNSAKPFLAKPMYDLFLKILKKKGAELSILSGTFAANMKVTLCNDGPVTLILDAGMSGIQQLNLSQMQGDQNVTHDEKEQESAQGDDTSEELRREFFANVSHELKTPIAAIRGYAEIIQDMPALKKNKTVQDFLSVIVRNAESLTNLIDEMLVVTGLESGSLTLVIKPYDIHAGVKRVVENILPKAKQAQVDLLTDVDPEMKDILLDAQRFDSVLVNLVDNAVKYNKPGGTVRIVVRQNGTHNIILVEDTGIGIPSDSRLRAFERFYRVDKSHSRLGGGSGLGLAIVKHVVHSHGGTISLRSEVGVGSSFSIFLPKNPSNKKVDFLPFL